MKIVHQKVKAKLSKKNGEVTLTYDETNIEILKEEPVDKSTSEVPGIATALAQENDRQVRILKATLEEGETKETTVIRKMLA